MNPSKISRRLAAVALAAALPMAPASALTLADPVDYDTATATYGTHVASNTCVAIATDEGTRYRIVVEGTAVASGAVATRARCGIVQEGRVVASVSSALPGSSSAPSGIVYVPRKPWSVCAGVYALDPDGTEVFADNCP